MVRGGGGVSVPPCYWGLWAVGALSLATLCLADEAIRCPVCSEERLANCRLPDGCEETCGVYSPRCGTGLRCYPPQGVDRPLHSLMHGQGLCTDERELEENSGEEREERGVTWLAPESRLVVLNYFAAMTRQDEIIPEHPNNSNIRCSLQDKRCIQKTLARHPPKSTNQRSNNPREDPRASLAPCRAELQRALDRLASNTRTHEDLYSFPIPNCDKNGDFHTKQCHPARDGQRGKCWCVDQKTGMRLPGPLELRGELDCHQLMTATLRV
ncbi:Insulin-like growth factor-binding protein 4 [Merluccius polli]|uniref:Insulin-like growth factor-binding protein 4 n=1 Tax=Merluccius polli TaxID=89951 RepID=A0AA47MW19_MERPO|nr:Insulin-like growth factor-binding protein 4 [Merluccius polli]